MSLAVNNTEVFRVVLREEDSYGVTVRRLEHVERIDVGEWIPDLLEMDHRIQLAKERSDAERAARLAQEKARDIRE